MEIESFEDAASATESAFSILSNAGELNIITAVRLRPMSSAEKQKGYRRVVDMAAREGNWVRIVNPVALAPSAQYTPPQLASSSSLRLAAQRHASASVSSAESPAFPPQFTQEFHFDHTFWSFDRAEGRRVASQSSIYDDLGLFTIENALLGFNCSIFAYGQTSAGKTYTMMGHESSSSDSSSSSAAAGSEASASRRGLIPRICRGLFDKLTQDAAASSGSTFSIHVSYIEIYHERAYDLLAQAANSSSSSMAGKESLKVRESPEAGVFVEHAHQVPVTSFEDIRVIIDEGNRVRSVAATNANLRSSRSHVILTLYLKQSGTSDTTASSSFSCESKKSKICLVDLAGSERADVSGANGTRLREAGSINKSLATLADVISALSKRSAGSAQERFVPYRNSILTRLLKESLGGNAKTIMLAAISPCCAHYEESLSTLKYIERAKSVVNVARVNSERGAHDIVVDALRREIMELKAQLMTSSPSATSVPAPLSSSSSLVSSGGFGIKKCTLALQLDDEGSDAECDNDKSAPISASESRGSSSGEALVPKTSPVESPLYAASLWFDEKEKSKLEREVAKLKVQLRKKEREFQLHEYTSKALSDKVSAQVLRQQAHVINLLGLHSKFLGLAKLRALDRWRYSITASSSSIRADTLVSKAVAPAPGVDKYVMTDSENNEQAEAPATAAKHPADAKCPGTKRQQAREEENPACTAEDDAVDLKPEYQKPSSDVKSSGGVASLLFGELGSKQQALVRGSGHQLQQVDVLCSSVVTDFFGDTFAPPQTKRSPAHVSSPSKSISSVSKSGNNQLEQLSLEYQADPSDDLALETDDDEPLRSSSKGAALIDEIIYHEAESSNQLLDCDFGGDSRNFVDESEILRLEISSGEEEDPSAVDQNDEDFDDEDEDGEFEGDDDGECEDALDAKPLSQAAQRQRVQSKLARCLDAIDISRKAIGPTVRKLKQITDKSAANSSDGFQVGTGMERQLLAHVDRSLVVVNQYVTDLSDMAESAGDLSVALSDKFEGLLSDFCLQTVGHVCDQLTAGAGGTTALARDQMEKHLDGLQVEIKELATMALSLDSHRPPEPDSDSPHHPVSNESLMIASLIELFGLSERIQFAWYAIDQKNRQRMVHFRSQQHSSLKNAFSSKSIEPKILKTQALKIQAQYDTLVARFEAQTVEFAKREEEDRLTLLLSTHKLEEEHELRVAELENQLKASQASVADLEERLLAQVSRVELLEQELELTAVVRSTNELLQKHHDRHNSVGELGIMHSESSSSPSPSSSAQCANIIVKLEEELASALIQINELETNKEDVVAAARRRSSIHLSLADDEASAKGEATSETQSDFHDQESSTLADREMLEYMERTSEIEKQNNEAISKLNAAMGERRQHHLDAKLGSAVAAPDIAALDAGHERAGDGMEFGVATVARIRQELHAALARGEMLEEQHLKLMMSFEHQTDAVLHLEEALYEAQERSKHAEDSTAELQQRASALEQELRATQELNKSLENDMKDVMSELCITECKCAELTAACDASQARVASLEEELQTALTQQPVATCAAEAANGASNSETALLVHATVKRSKELEAANALLETRCSELEASHAVANAGEQPTSELAVAADVEQQLADAMMGKLELEKRHKNLLAQQEAESMRLISLQQQLAIAQTQTRELEANWKLRDEEAQDTCSQLSDELKAALQSNEELTREITALIGELSSVKAQMGELEARSAAERSGRTASQVIVNQRLEANLAASALQVESLLVEKQRQTQAESIARADIEQRLADVVAKKSELETQVEGLLEQQEADASRLVSLQQQLTTAQTERRELTANLRLSEEEARDANIVASQRLEASLQLNGELTDEIDALKSELSSLQTRGSDLEDKAAATLSHSAASQALLIQRFEAELAASSQRSETLLEKKQQAHEDLQRVTSDLEAAFERSLGTEMQLSDTVKALEELRVASELSETRRAELELALAAAMKTNESLEAQAARLQQQLCDTEPQIAALSNQLADLTSTNAALQGQAAKLQAERVEFQSQCAKMRSQQQLELQEKCRFFRELVATQKTKVASLAAELRVAYAQFDELVAAKQKPSADQSSQLSELESQVQSISSQVQALEAERAALSAANASLAARTQELEQECVLKTAAIQALEAEHSEAITSCISLNNNISRLDAQLSAVQAEHDATKRHLSQTQAKFQELSLSSQKAAAELQAELSATRSHAQSSEAEVVSLQARAQAAEASLLETREQRATLVAVHEAELRVLEAHVVQLAQRDREAAEVCAGELEEELAAQSLIVLKLEQDLGRAQLIARQSEEALDSQTLLLAQADEELAVARSRASALESQLHEATLLRDTQLTKLREELLADFEAQLTLMRHEVEQTDAENVEGSTLRIQDLERQLEEKCSELDRVSGEFELQVSMAIDHHHEELLEAKELAKHWEAQHEARAREIHSLESDLQMKIERLNADISERERETQILQASVERSQSSHSKELKQLEAKHSSTVAQLRQELSRFQALARDWELKHHELDACVSPDAVRKVREQIEAAKAHADECEATYRVELENKLQLEFDLASVRKELHVAKQQLVELQCREIEASVKDPAGAALRSQARQNELAALENERQELQEKSVQVAKREASVKRLESSAQARLEDLQLQQQKRVRELEASSQAAQAQGQLRIAELQGAVIQLSQQLVESSCRSEMQGEELHSFRSWTALRDLLNASDDSGIHETGGFDFGYGNGGGESAGVLAGKKLSPEARRLVLKHLNSLDTWFERAILGKTSSDAGRSERRASLLAVLESSDRGFSVENLAVPKHRQSGGDDADDDDDGLIDASDAEAVAVELEDLGDELLAMCSDNVGATSGGSQGQGSTTAQYEDLDAIFGRDAALSQVQRDTGSPGDAKLSLPAATKAAADAFSGSWPPPSPSLDKYLLAASGGDAKAGLSEVAQLRLTVLRLKQVLDAKEEAILFLDDKMRYYEELLRADGGDASS